jgi:para-nitrobenzyl esterase
MDCLRALDAATIASASGRWTPNSVTPDFPEWPATAIAAGNWHKVPLIVGSTRYEGKQGIFFSVGPNAGSMTVAEYEAKVRQFYGPNADAILAQYPAADYEKPAYALAAIDTDSGFGCRSYEFASQVASQAPVYEYEFADPTSPTVKGLRIAGLDMSSAHTAELAYLYTYAEVERPLQGGEVQLAARMKQYWGDFARAGQLSEPWLPVTADDHPVLRLQASGDVIISTFADEHKCGFWATVR